MKKYAIVAVAMLLLASPLRAQTSNDVQPPQSQPPISAAPQDSAESRAGSPATPNLPAAPAITNEPRQSAKTTPVALRELSPWSMFLSADPLVQAVIVGLVFASLVTWTIFLAKSAKLSITRRQLEKSLARISTARTLSEAQLAMGRSRNVLSILLAAAIQEVRNSADGSSDSSIKERAASTFSEIVRMEARAVRLGMGLLATVGSTAPFVGLFGTVWGIMNSFIGISKSQTTNLAVVAPGIAEALLATACGLAAAIPAVIIYNYFTRKMRGYIDLVGRAAGAVGRLLSRDLDRAAGRIHTHAAE
jgi:biopolymer transport protein ExbB